MNKCHYYLSSGLWEVVKCYYESKTKLYNVYFWGMAVAPHHTCFASHIVSSPWQQSWNTLKLLEYCHKSPADFKHDLFSSSDIQTVKKEIDFQYILRNYAGDAFVQELFEGYGKFLQLGAWSELESDAELFSLQELLHKLLKSSPSTAFSLVQQLSTLTPRLITLSSGSVELTMLLIGSDPPPLPRILPMIAGSNRRELFLLLLANSHNSILRRIEAEETQKIVDSSLFYLQEMTHRGLQPSQLFLSMILTKRHFIIYLLELLELSPTLPQTDHVPNFAWPLLLFRLWGNKDISEFQIQSLIGHCKESCSDQAVLRVCFMLEWYLSFSRWSVSQGAEKQVGLEAARDHSVLRLIHSSTDLAQADWIQVRALLHEPWDLQLLDGFCAHILLLRALMAAAVMKRERVRLADAVEAEQRLSAEYHAEVTEKLEEIRNLIKGLWPLWYRLEVLENLFGLLFVTWEDLNGVHLRRRSQTEVRPPPSARGFLCCPHVLRDLVRLIKECTAELEREPKTEQEVNIPCSIKPSQIENRLDRLTESLSEASWRLQLVTNPEFVEDVGSVGYGHERHTFEPEWLVDTWQEPGKTKRRSCHEKREESGSQSPPSSGETERGSERPPGPGFMHQMLASDYSLVVRCLVQGDLLNADHIITMMSTEENRQVLEGELNFTQAVNDVRRKLASLNESPCRKLSDSGPKSPRKTSGLQAVQQVTAQAITTTALSNHVERFLSVATLPTIQGSSKVSLGNMLQCMENSTATVTLDLAITASTTYQDFRDLLNLAGKHCPELTARLQSPLGGTTCSKPLGYIAFAQTLMALLHELNKEMTMSPAAFFRSRYASFSLKTLKEQETLWKNLRNLQQDVVKSRLESQNLAKDAGKGQRNIKSMQKILENVAKCTENSAEALDLGKSDTSSTDLAKNVNYSELLNRYLTDLASLSIDFITHKLDGDDLVTFHTLLEMSAVEVLDRLVFTHHVDPAQLEKKAQQLGFNLSASLVWGCCPPIPQGSNVLFSEIPSLPDSTVLNLPQPNSTFDIEWDAKTAVSSILNDLLTALANCAVKIGGEDDSCSGHISKEVILSAAREPLVIETLKLTQVLASINVSSVSTNDACPFYINLCNLMTLHCLLNPAVRESLFSGEEVIREAALWFAGYHLGGLGFVSVAEVRRALCGEEIVQPFFPRACSIPIKGIEPDPRMLFLVPALQSLTPAPRLAVCSSTSTETALIEAVEAYARRYVVAEDSRLKVPAFLDWYLNSVLMLEEAEGSGDGGSPRPRRRFQILLEFLMENSQGGEWHSSLKSWHLSDLTLDVSPGDEWPSVTLDYCRHNHATERTETVSPSVSRSQRWQSRVLSEPIVKQLTQSSRVLVDLVARLHEGRNDSEERALEMGHDVLLDERMRCLEALMSSPWTHGLAPLFQGNAVLGALHKTPPAPALWAFINDCVREKRWKECWEVFKFLPDFLVHCDVNLRRMRDLLLFSMAAEASSENGPGWLYAQRIVDSHIRIESLKLNHCFWPGAVAVKQFFSVIRDEPKLTSAVVSEINQIIKKITVFSAIAESCSDIGNKSWAEVAYLSNNTPNIVLQSLLHSDLLHLCLEWISLPGVLESILTLIDATFVIRFASRLPRRLSHLFSRIPAERTLELCEEAILQLSSVPALRSIAELCLEISSTDKDQVKYRKMLLCVEMLAALQEEDQNQLAHLATEPVLVLEQLIMNTRLDAVALLLKRLRQLPGNDLISVKEVNDLLTLYASRAVELDVIRVLQTSSRENFFVSPASSEFTIPAQIPDKSQWVPDNQVAVCMCCRLVSFSMFNRRHHCRRCGRVVCAACSVHRMKVDSYNGVAVRVCQTCYTQNSKPEGDRTSSDVLDENNESEDIHHHWSLSTDPVRNAMVREEFVYEHSPNVSLCLAIFNLLPDSPTFTSLLLDESEKLLEVLQGRDTTGNPEVDYTVLIKIIRALVVGAKVRYGQAGLATGVLSCDRLLSQVDVISLLVRNHCTRLIPPEPLNPSTMRALRDRLVEEELWDLAIELSTKAGLSLSGVWATWGKVLLSAGCWVEARQKFAQCLVPTSKQMRATPLLDEICHIIQSTSFSVLRPNASAQEVLELVSNLKGLANGKTPVRGGSGPGSLQYSEQEWYLNRYGSVSGLIRFYLRYEQWNSALNLVIQRHLDTDMFVDCILLPAYTNNAQENFKTEILAIDPTIEPFKRYLAAGCLHFQKTQSLCNLHDLQLFMQDFVRASMTCIHLYQSYGTNFSRQLEASDLLQTALRHLEEEIRLSTKQIHRLDHVMRLENRDLNRHMNTIWRQLEMTKFLARCEAGQPVLQALSDVSWQHNVVPTLFDGQPFRTTLAAVCVLAGKNVEEGFGLAFRVIQDYTLDHVEVFTKVGKVLGSYGRGTDLVQLADCIKTSGAEQVVSTCDNVMAAAVTAMATADCLSNVQLILPLITNIDLKISALSEARRLKEAYLMAVKHNRLSFIQPIMEEAERSGQMVIRNICRKKLGLAVDDLSLSSNTLSGDSM